MIISFYDKDFVALQDNASLNVGNWSLRRKAVDFDDFSATSEAFVENINPTFVVIKDDRGRYKYGAFAGIPELTNDNQTQVQGSDLKTLFNNDILVKFGTYTNLVDMFNYVFTEFQTQVVQSEFHVEFDLTDITDIAMGLLVPDTEKHQVVQVWDDVIQPYLKFYNLYMDSRLDLGSKTIIFTIAKSNKYKKALRLYEFGINNYGKWIASVNESQAVVSYGNELYYSSKYILTSNNVITNDLTLRDLYPIKNRIVLKETEDSTKIQELLTEGVQECLTSLIEARYNESVEFSSIKTQFENEYFDSTLQIYIRRNEFYKDLPVGEIYEDNTGARKLVLGYKPDDVVIYIGG